MWFISLSWRHFFHRTINEILSLYIFTWTLFHGHSHYFIGYFYEIVSCQDIILIYICLVYKIFTQFQGLSWSWSYGSWKSNYLCNQCLSSLKLWVWTPFMVRCTWYNIISLRQFCDFLLFPPPLKLTAVI